MRGNAVAPIFNIEDALDNLNSVMGGPIGAYLKLRSIEGSVRVMLYDVAAALAVHADPATPAISLWLVNTDVGCVPNLLGAGLGGNHDEEELVAVCANSLALPARAVKLIGRFSFRPNTTICEMGPVGGGAEQWSQYWNLKFNFQIPDSWTSNAFRSAVTTQGDLSDSRTSRNWFVVFLELPGVNAFVVNTFSVHMRHSLVVKVCSEAATLGEVLG